MSPQKGQKDKLWLFVFDVSNESVKMTHLMSYAYSSLIVLVEQGHTALHKLDNKHYTTF
ncbi:hypothetical protein SNOG_15892 [Parastagonospora nodorum SN15]|uniref:Uncharacterized protein n=1 Tax=Phaeosphaeria nodorum (strain SN15 / ATCC MYA-4574 / FGSC 10173) TaxID=321614 RepID=Q0TX80_PHANO|nr:hypothetical protein SNOG_15892 [Parastagonospora nodorum SN15]EAT76730.1 hypothetical protein SNOG_15892 [Parastagonospora nodorum SN15]